MNQLTEEQQQLFSSKTSIEDYEVIKPIGKGKFAVVYRAIRKNDKEIVALKKISIDAMDAKSREKTLKEVRLLQTLSHPNIIQYIDAFLADNELCIILEWAEAGDLKRQIRKANEKNSRFDERIIWKYFSQICLAIQYMHEECRIMHRDIKPANVFLTIQGIVKVGDLGLGRHLSENTMEAHSKVGTPLYMSPEVLRGNGYDWKSDIWSLGCILYELAMLKSPFKSEGLNLYGLFKKINKGDYPPLPDVYSRELKDLVTQMISQEANNRPSIQSVTEISLHRFRYFQELKKNGLEHKPTEIKVNSNNRQDENMNISKTRLSGNRPNLSDGDKLKKIEMTENALDAKAISSNQKEPETRPKSSKKKNETSDSIMLMESILDKLRILSHQVSVPSIARRLHVAYFVTESPSQANSNFQKFEDFLNLSSWLLNLIDINFKPDQLTTANESATQLLLCMEKTGFISSESGIEFINSSTLTCGFGKPVCLILNWLLDKALKMPPYKIKPPTRIAEKEEIVTGDEELINECNNTESDDSDTEEEKSDRFDMAISNSARIITPMVNKDAWQKECIRILPKLKQLMKDIARNDSNPTVWRHHADLFRRTYNIMSTGENRKPERKHQEPTGYYLDNITQKLKFINEETSKDIQSITSLESRVTVRQKVQCETYKSICHDFAQLKLHAEKLEGYINAKASELSVIIEHMDEKNRNITFIAEDIQDSSKLKKLKKTLLKIREEINHINRNTGILSTRMWKLKHHKQF